jgi:hypothetical protein
VGAAGETPLSERTHSDRGWTRRPLSWLLLIGAVYVALRVAAFAGISPYVSPDSATFKETATKDVFSSGFLAGLRPWTTPLLYKVVTDDTARIWVQFVISVLAWLAFAKTVADVVSERMRLVAFAVVLLPSVAVQVTLWDSTLLSESLAVSFTVLLMAAWLRFLRERSTLNVVLVLVITLLWVFTRDTHAYLTALLGLALLISLARPGERWKRAVVGAGCVVIAGLSVVSANQVYTVTLSRSATGTSIRSPQAGRWEFPLINVIDKRVLTDSGRRAWFESHGMPVNAELTRFAGLEAGSADFAQFTSPGLSGFRGWLEKRGRSVYSQYLLTHPFYVAKSFATGSAPKAVGAPDVAAYQPLARRVLPGPLHEVVFSERQRADGAIDKLLTAAGIALLAAGFALGLVRLVRAPRDPLSYFVPALIVAIAVEALATWHGDAGEVERHEISAAVLLHAGGLVALVLGLDAYLARRRRDN